MHSCWLALPRAAHLAELRMSGPNANEGLRLTTSTQVQVRATRSERSNLLQCFSHSPNQVLTHAARAAAKQAPLVAAREGPKGSGQSNFSHSLLVVVGRAAKYGVPAYEYAMPCARDADGPPFTLIYPNQSPSRAATRGAWCSRARRPQRA